MARIIGIVATDAISKTYDEKSLVEFSFLERRYYKGKDGETKSKKTFYNCTKWNSEAVAEFLTKGTPIEIDGTIEPKAYTTKDGELKAYLKLTVKSFEFLPTPYAETTNTPIEIVGEDSTEPVSDLPF